MFTSRIVTISSSAPSFNSMVAVRGVEWSAPIAITLTDCLELSFNLPDLRGATDSAISKSAFSVA